MNHKNTKDNNDSEMIKSINRSLELLKEGYLSEALTLFTENLKIKWNDSLSESGIKCCKYWIQRLSKIDLQNDDYEKGKLLFSEWEKFESFTITIKNFNKKVINNAMYLIYTKALNAFKKDLLDNKIVDLETSYMIGLAYKKIGDYNNAVFYLFV